jgi:tetratricopeptide (TPR) repeat protein
LYQSLPVFIVLFIVRFKGYFTVFCLSIIISDFIIFFDGVYNVAIHVNKGGESMKNKHHGIFVAFAVILLLSACPQPPVKNTNANQAAQLVQQGDSLSNQSNYDEAIKDYTAAIEMDPTLEGAYLGRGQAYYSQGSSLRSLSDYSTAIELDPNSAEAYYGRGWSQLANSAWDGAVSDFTKSLELAPDQTRAYNGRAWGYLKKAIWVFEGNYGYWGLFYLFESHHGLTMAYAGRGWYYVKRPQWETAVIPDLTTSIVHDPDPAECYCNIGFAHAKKAQWTHAIEDYKAAIAKDPSLDWSRFNTAWSTGMKENWDPVIADYGKAIELVTGQPVPATATGSQTTEAQEWDMAIASYNKVIELSKDPALTQKAQDALKLIDEIRVDINK